MLKQKEIELKERLMKIINEIGRASRHCDAIKQDIASDFKSRNLSAMRASFVMCGNLNLNTLEDSEEDLRFLFLFTQALSKTLEGKEDIKVNVNDYFTKVEVNQWQDYREEIQQDNIFPIEVEDAIPLSDKIWQVVLTAQQLDRLKVGNALLYNFKTQRNPKITLSGEKINMIIPKINEITGRLLDNKQFPDPIILNIVNNGESTISYNKKNKILLILEGSIINIVDGFHRIVANSLAIEKNPDLIFKWQITFTFLSENDAYDYMSQKNKQKPMKKEYVQQMNYNQPENLVVDVIMNDRLSELAGKMKDDDAYIKLNRALTKKSIIARAIKECYGKKLDVSTNIRNIGNWIVEFTDYLMGLYTEEFINNPYEIKQTSLINHKNMFYGYIALSSILQNKQDWKQCLKKTMESIDFSNTNKLWRDIGILNNEDSNKITRHKLYSLFKEGLNNG